jgi:threonine/homoserine/homoserine lactone efflux protein
MNVELWMLYFSTVFVATIIPGPSVLLGLSHGIVYGKKKSVATALGVTSAAVIMGFTSLLGVGAILITSGLVFRIVKYLGAVYLVYIGIKTWRAPVRDYKDKYILEGARIKVRGKLFRQAFLVGMSNPKAIIFFTALFPQFLEPAKPQLPQHLLLLTTLGLIVFLCMMLYSLGGESLSPLVSQIKFRRILNKFTGGIFASFGIGIAISE